MYKYISYFTILQFTVNNNTKSFNNYCLQIFFVIISVYIHKIIIITHVICLKLKNKFKLLLIRLTITFTIIMNSQYTFLSKDYSDSLINNDNKFSIKILID